MSDGTLDLWAAPEPPTPPSARGGGGSGGELAALTVGQLTRRIRSILEGQLG